MTTETINETKYASDEQTDRPVRYQRRLSFLPDVQLAVEAGAVTLGNAWGAHRLRGLVPAELAVLHALREADIAEQDLATSRLSRFFDRPSVALVTVTITSSHGHPVLRVTPINRTAARVAAGPPPTGQTRLSRFAYLRRLPETADGLVLESPLSSHRLAMPDPGVAALVSALVGGDDIAQAARRSGIEGELADLIVEVLSASNLLEQADAGLPMWDFQDLLFHQRSRFGLHDYPMGGQFLHADRSHATAIPAMESEATVVDLAVPRWDEVVGRDASLTEVLESRHSVRTYASEPVSIDQLGELLYRAARVRGIALCGGEHPYVGVDRPYPNGGALGELEIYVVAHRCGRLAPAVYRYDSAGHRLVLRNADPDVRARLARQAQLATGDVVTDPQIQFCITSRLDRVQWKYSGIAYAVTLKHVGVLMQTLYLVATAMGLSPCANGSGDTDLVSRAIGVEWTEQAPVGELLLGGAAREPQPAAQSFRDVVEQQRTV